jgi:hypothetical protein
MPKLKADFLNDWIDHLTRQLKDKWPDEVDKLDRDEIAPHYFDSLRKRLTVQPRALKLSDKFIPPNHPRTDWPTFAEKVLSGQDLNPHLSTAHASLFYRDGLLDDWGIHHFHLNMQPHPREKGFFSRTGLLVMGYVTEDCFYAIDVYGHGKGEPPPWGNIDIIETLHRNWPEAIARFRLNGISAEFRSENERGVLRRNGYGQTSTVSDGTVYGPPGGLHSFGHRSVSFDSRRLADIYTAKITALQADLECALPQLFELLKGKGYDGESAITGKLVFLENGIMVHLPEYSLHLDPRYVEDS